LESVKFITDITDKSKTHKITTIHNDNQVYAKVIKMALVQRPSGLIKVEGSTIAFKRESTLIKVENVSWKQISIINLNSYWILGKWRHHSDRLHPCQ
jgi:hypothetical protein